MKRRKRALKGVDWDALPVGARALSVAGGSWIKRNDGQWRDSSTGMVLSKPGADVFLVVLVRAKMVHGDIIKKRRHRKFNIGGKHGSVFETVKAGG